MDIFFELPGLLIVSFVLLVLITNIASNGYVLLTTGSEYFPFDIIVTKSFLL